MVFGSLIRFSNSASPGMRHQIPIKYFDEVARTGSIRQAAEKLSITSSALNRRILALEDELGVELFERIPSGVRLSTAGEMMIRHVRRHLADMDQLKSALADLSGERRGHVTIGCGEALLSHFLPAQVKRYQESNPGVSFSLLSCGRADAAPLLSQFSCDLVLCFEPKVTSEMTVLCSSPQRVHALIERNHELANQDKLRISDCADCPLALPTRRNAIRIMLETESAKRNLIQETVVESDNFSCLRNYVLLEDAIAFQISMGIPPNLESSGSVTVPCYTRDFPEGKVVLSQLKGRNLPVAAAKFAEMLSNTLEADL